MPSQKTNKRRTAERKQRQADARKEEARLRRLDRYDDRNKYSPSFHTGMDMSLAAAALLGDAAFRRRL